MHFIREPDEELLSLSPFSSYGNGLSAYAPIVRLDLIDDNNCRLWILPHNILE